MTEYVCNECGKRVFKEKFYLSDEVACGACIEKGNDAAAEARNRRQSPKRAASCWPIYSLSYGCLPKSRAKRQQWHKEKGLPPPVYQDGKLELTSAKHQDAVRAAWNDG